MSKTLVVLVIIVAMLMPAWSMGCKSSPEPPAIYGSKTLKGIRFSYPADWEEVSDELEQEIGGASEIESAGWVDSSDSAALAVFAFDMRSEYDDAALTETDKQEIVELLPMLMLISADMDYDAAADIVIDGRWASETEFEGILSGIDGKGYILATYNGNDAIVFMYVVKPKYMDEMRSVYNKLKSSISFGGSVPANVGGATVQPTDGSLYEYLPAPSEIEEMEYMNYSLEGVRFNYPSGWRRSKIDIGPIVAAEWMDPTLAAFLDVYVEDVPAMVTDEEKRDYANESGHVLIEEVMDKYDTSVTQEEIEVAGAWALEMEVHGKIGGKAYLGYILGIIQDTTHITMMYFVEDRKWDELAGVYTEVKNSIEYGGGWNKRFGAPYDDKGTSVQQTSDGGFIVTGFTKSYYTGGGHLWLLKTNGRGFKHWDKLIGRYGRDEGTSVQETRDGEYIVLGCTDSIGNGGKDVWLIKVDSEGNQIWERTFGGRSDDCASQLKQTSDSGYIIIGSTQSFGTGTEDAWLIKTDSMGEVVWDETFGMSGSDEGRSVQQTNDGGYIITGQTSSGKDGVGEIWLIKTDSVGEVVWETTLGLGHGNEVDQTDDGGYIVVGSSLIKTDSGGTVVWEKSPSENEFEGGASVQQTSDGGYIVVVNRRDYSVGAAVCSAWLRKIDSAGEDQWSNEFGGTKCDQINLVRQTFDGGYIMVGSTQTYGVNSSYDVWLVKTDAEGNAE